MERREFIKVSTLAGGGLLLSFNNFANGLLGNAKNNVDNSTASSSLGHFLSIKPDGEILFQLTKHEMGQGVSTSMAMIISDELCADWQKVKIVFPTADLLKYQNDTYGGHGTGGSNTVIQTMPRLRWSGAIARQMLIEAAAWQWKVASEDCYAENHEVRCRTNGKRLGFGALAEAASKVPVPTQVTLKERGQFTLIGKSQPGKLIPDMVTGKSKYGIDVKIPGMLYAVVARSPVYRGKLKSFDASTALAVKGVKKIVKTTSVAGIQGSRYPYDVREGVAVVADSFWTAKNGRDALKVEWDLGVNAEKNMADFEALAEERGKRKLAPTGFRGDDNAVTSLDHVKKTLFGSYIFPYQLHALMEPLNCTVHFRGDTCEFWIGSQSPNHLIDEINRVFGLKKENVIVHTFPSGGGFGRRFYPDMAIEAAAISKEAGNIPVKVMWTREDDLQMNAAHCYQRFDYQASLDANNNVYAWYEKECRTYNWDRKVAPPELTWMGYDIPNSRYDYEDMFEESIVQSVAWRAVMANGWALSECFIDEIAAEVKKDPYAFRLSMLKEGKEVYVAHGNTVSNTRLIKVLKLAAEKSEWSKPLAAGRGKGIATYPYMHGNSYCAIVAEVSIVDEKVRVDRVVCAVDCGLVVNPSGAKNQIEGGVVWGLSAVLHGGLEVQSGKAVKTNFHQHKVARMNECPKIEVYFVEDAGDRPWGTGELSNPVIVPAVLNAIYAATGQRIRKLPAVLES
jgi:isoquinoline 1-oxidoreductase beta subunit